MLTRTVLASAIDCRGTSGHATGDEETTNEFLDYCVATGNPTAGGANMHATQKDEREVGEGLPNPLLNPMINPLLGKNLGRWANVYYTTPAEKREQAVLELLRELESARKPQREDKASVATEKQNIVQTESQKEALICPACLHGIVAHQHFCDLYGVELKTGKNSDPAQQVTAPAPQPSPPTIERRVEDWQGRSEKDLVESGTAHDKSQSWKYVAFVIITFTAIGFYWLWQIHSQTAEPQSAHRIDRDNPAISKPVTTQLQSNAASGERKTVMRASAQLASDLSKRSKPSAGKPFGCREDHLGNCSVAEVYNRTMMLSNTIDAVFIDYNRRVTQLRMDAKAHENDSAKQRQERLRQGNYSAQLWEDLRLRSYLSNQKNDALRYRTELLRRCGGRRSQNSKLLGAYKNPRLCLEMHFVAEDLRRLAAKLQRSEIPPPVLPPS